MFAIPQATVPKIVLALAVLAMTVGVGVASASSSSSPASQSERQGTEAAISSADLLVELERALGGAFGGVWLEPATGQLHVGVTSGAGRRRAEAVAAQAGLGENVTATPVSSSWAELSATQSQLNHRLRDLLKAGEARTSLSPEQNSVKVTLGSSVSPSRRAALEQEAKAAAVKVLVETVPVQSLVITPAARCAEFVKFKAYCDPTLVSGVSIIGEKEENGEGVCTAGPVVLNKKAVTETLLLTAGHCIVGEGAVGKKWSAFEKQGPPKGKKEIGKAVVTLNIEAGADVGAIQVEQTNWAKAGATPLSPGIAPWSAAAETEPFPVIKEEPVPAVGSKTCFSGQRSGLRCGEIVGKNIAAGGWEELVEVKLEKGTTGGKGDSGSPEFAEAAYKMNNEGNVEGVLVAIEGPGEESETIFFQPLSFLLGKLKTQKGREYELLTTANETRKMNHVFNNPNGGKIELKITPDGTGKTTHHVIDVPGNGSITCKSFEGHTAGVEGTTLPNVTIESLSYSECTFLGQAAGVRMNGCTYNFSPEGTVKAECAGANQIEVEAAGCIVKFDSGQDFESGITYHNINPSGTNEEITVETQLSGIHGAASGSGCVATGAFTTGEYTTGNFILTGVTAGTGTMTPVKWS